MQARRASPTRGGSRPRTRWGQSIEAQIGTDVLTRVRMRDGQGPVSSQTLTESGTDTLLSCLIADRATPSAPDWRSGGLGPSCLRGPGARIPSRTTRNGTRHPAPRHAASAGSSTSVGDRPASPIRPSRLGVSVLDGHPVPAQLKAPHARAFNAGTEGEDRRGRSRASLCTLGSATAQGSAARGGRAGWIRPARRARFTRGRAERGNDREPLGCCVQAFAPGFRISRRGLSQGPDCA